MAETSGFFDAEELLSGGYDREYVSEQFAQYFALFIGNGVFASPTNQLKVVAGEGMNIIVKKGWAFINGRWYHNDSDLTIPVPPNTTAATITSGVFVQQTKSDRNIHSILATGRTTPDRESPYWELQLATITIPVGTTAITNAMITDTRTNENVCGFVKGLLDGVITTEDLFAQYTAIFMQWFDHMKDQLSEDAAGHLQEEIDAMDAIHKRLIEEGSSNLINLYDMSWDKLNQDQSRNATFDSNNITFYPNSTSSFVQAYTNKMPLSKLGLQAGDVVSLRFTVDNIPSGVDPRFILSFFDASGTNVGSSLSGRANTDNTNKTIPSGASLIQITCRADQNKTLSSGTLTMENIQLVKGSTLPTYDPYYKSVHDLTIENSEDSLMNEGVKYPVINGIRNYTDSNDVYNKKLGFVDLGTLNWIKVSGNRFGSSSIANLVAIPTSNRALANIKCAKYTTDTFVNVYAGTDKTIAITDSTASSAGNINIVDTAYSDATDFKSAMSGNLLFFELATPQTWNTKNTLIVGAGGSETLDLNALGNGIKYANSSSSNLPSDQACTVFTFGVDNSARGQIVITQLDNRMFFRKKGPNSDWSNWSEIQPKSDASLQTTNKTIVGAINELKNRDDGQDTKLNAIGTYTALGSGNNSMFGRSDSIELPSTWRNHKALQFVLLDDSRTRIVDCKILNMKWLKAYSLKTSEYARHIVSLWNGIDGNGYHVDVELNGLINGNTITTKSNYAIVGDTAGIGYVIGLD